YTLKKRDEAKSMIILVSDTAMIREYVSQPSEKVLEYLFAQSTPTTAIFENAINLPVSLINRDGTIAIRIAKDEFCQALIQKLTRPLVSTSANISGNAYPHNFAEINAEIKNGVDYIVQHRQDDVKEYAPSSIIKLDASGEIKHLR
ncbi:MAG: Sua5/YciO/YrdC/YwlC family protein, partial [Ferruginibacter sp.]